jgi:hypothetical protein
LTANPPSDIVRYFYAALGFSTLMMMTFAAQGVARLRANQSALAARRSLGGRGPWSLAAPTLAAAWLASFATLTVGYLYMRFVLGIDFGGRGLEIMAILAAGALSATALGAVLGATPLPGGVRSGLVAGVSCLAAALAGLYGQASQRLGQQVAEAAPWATWVNPAREVYEALFSLYCYDTFERAASLIAGLVAMSLALLAGVGLLLRRVRYDRL